MNIRFTEQDADTCGYRFNCGPSALCAALGLTPAEIRPHLLDFESKGYMSPTMMMRVLKGLGVGYDTMYRGDIPGRQNLDLTEGEVALVRVQWSGPWCNHGVPMAARYKATHWIAAGVKGTGWAYDVNAMLDEGNCNGLISYRNWAEQLVPWLIKELRPKADGDWWITHIHVLELDAWKGLGK